ncbi:hypothetical protein LEMLEM_LOCUS9031, partial [Lemmus lemmus]
CLEDCGARPLLLAISKVSGTRESTWLFLKLKVFMPEMKLNSTWARDVLMYIKKKKRQTKPNQSDLESNLGPWKQWHMVPAKFRNNIFAKVI